tara:strand:- start:4852 stop:5499 length:648 start_codon:yes stop_codon:yes gene_type:complete
MRILKLLSAVSVAALLVACGNSNTTPVPDAGTEAETGTEMRAADVPQAEPLPPADAAVVFQDVGRLVERLEAPAGLTVSASGINARLSGGPSAETALQIGPLGGATLRLPAALERSASGGRVRVTISARTVADGGAQQFAALYTTREVGHSGWTRFTPSDQFQAFSFEYDVPPMVDGRRDYVGILPDATGSGQAIEIAFVAVEIVQAGPAGIAED